MNYYLSKHARDRMAERLVPDRLIADALENPTSISRDRAGNTLVKKLYRKSGKDRLLLLVYRNVAEGVLIITIIDTSKVKKYL